MTIDPRFTEKANGIVDKWCDEDAADVDNLVSPIARALQDADTAARRDQWINDVDVLRDWLSKFTPSPLEGAGMWRAVGLVEGLREDDWPLAMDAIAARRGPG